MFKFSIGWKRWNNRRKLQHLPRNENTCNIYCQTDVKLLSGFFGRHRGLKSSPHVPAARAADILSSNRYGLGCYTPANLASTVCNIKSVPTTTEDDWRASVAKTLTLDHCQKARIEILHQLTRRAWNPAVINTSEYLKAKFIWNRDQGKNRIILETS